MALPNSAVVPNESECPACLRRVMEQAQSRYRDFSAVDCCSKTALACRRHTARARDAWKIAGGPDATCLALPVALPGGDRATADSHELAPALQSPQSASPASRHC